MMIITIPDHPSCFSLVSMPMWMRTEKKVNTVERICCKSKQTQTLTGLYGYPKKQIAFSSGEQLSLLFTHQWCFSVLCPLSALACCCQRKKKNLIGNWCYWSTVAFFLIGNTIERVPATWGTLSAAVKSRFQKEWLSDFRSVCHLCSPC